MNSPPNFSLMASTSGLDHGSCCGPFGFGGTAGAAGFAPGGGGGFGTAAFGGSAGCAGFSGGWFSVCCLSFSSSATLNLGRTRWFDGGAPHKDVDSTTSIEPCQRPTLL